MVFFARFAESFGWKINVHYQNLIYNRLFEGSYDKLSSLNSFKRPGCSFALKKEATVEFDANKKSFCSFFGLPFIINIFHGTKATDRSIQKCLRREEQEKERKKMFNDYLLLNYLKLTWPFRFGFAPLDTFQLRN